MWRLSPCWQRVLTTDQELVAGVLIALFYVHGLDLSVGDAGTVLVKEGEEEHMWDMLYRTRRRSGKCRVMRCLAVGVGKVRMKWGREASTGEVWAVEALSKGLFNWSGEWREKVRVMIFDGSKEGGDVSQQSKRRAAYIQLDAPIRCEGYTGGQY